MPAYQESFRVSTRGHCDVHDITGEVRRIAAASGVSTGIVNVGGNGLTLAITTIEFEPGAVSDLKRALDRIAPENGDYAHNAPKEK